MKELINHKFVETKDGSRTLFSKTYDELCHSEHGAITETNTHYIKGCQIKRKLKDTNKLYILEVGFGTGIGFLETKKLFIDPFRELHFYSFEIDLELIKLFAEDQKIDFTIVDDVYTFSQNGVHLHILHGDARDSIKKLENLKFDAIYQDAFSPKKNAILWTVEWFEDLLKIAKKDCILSTYSASSSIRKSLVNAHWGLYEGENFGFKRSSTRAVPFYKTSEEILDKLKRSPVPPITDKNYREYTLG